MKNLLILKSLLLLSMPTFASCYLISGVAKDNYSNAVVFSENCPIKNGTQDYTWHYDCFKKKIKLTHFVKYDSNGRKVGEEMSANGKWYQLSSGNKFDAYCND